MDPEAEKVIDKIRTLRTGKNISIVRLSVDSGISRSHLYYIESKQTSPSLDTLAKIAKSLGVTLKELFD